MVAGAGFTASGLWPFALTFAPVGAWSEQSAQIKTRANQDNKKAPLEAGLFHCLVAGAGFEPTTFRL